MANMTAAREASARRVVGADAAWDVLLGLVLLTAALPAGAEVLGVPTARPWPVFVVLGAASIGYGAVLARASRCEDSAQAICAPTSIANGVSAVVLMALLVVLRGDLTATGAAVVGMAAVGCAGLPERRALTGPDEQPLLRRGGRRDRP